MVDVAFLFGSLVCPCAIAPAVNAMNPAATAAATFASTDSFILSFLCFNCALADRPFFPRSSLSPPFDQRENCVFCRKTLQSGLLKRGLVFGTVRIPLHQWMSARPA